MFGIAEAAASSGSVHSSEVLLLIGAAMAAAFWKSILKFGIALVGVALAVLIAGGASVIATFLHH